MRLKIDATGCKKFVRRAMMTGEEDESMANLTQFNPFREFARLDPLREFEDMFRLSNFSRENEMQPIRVDVHEDAQNYTVRADIPGVKKEDIKVDVVGNRVSISAETKRVDEQQQGSNVVRCERYYGQQYRNLGDCDCEVLQQRMLAQPHQIGLRDFQFQFCFHGLLLVRCL
jgi:HSP20 family protein